MCWGILRRLPRNLQKRVGVVTSRVHRGTSAANLCRGIVDIVAVVVIVRAVCLPVCVFSFLFETPEVQVQYHAVGIGSSALTIPACLFMMLLCEHGLQDCGFVKVEGETSSPKRVSGGGKGK